MVYASAASLLHVILFLLVVSAPSSVAAQSGITLAGGPAGWDLSGTGTGTTFALRWDRGLARIPALGPLSVEVGVGWFQDGQTGQGAVDLLLPEAGLRIGLASPLQLGVGALRPELRIRNVDPWVTIVDYSLGVRRLFR